MGDLPDLDFVNTLRAAVVAYLEAVDLWEAAYRKYHRMPDHELTISSDMEPEQREYAACRRGLELLLPRATSLCLKCRIRDPFPSLLRTSLGPYASQHRTGSAIGRNERNAVAECLVQLADACSGWTPAAAPPEAVPTPAIGRSHDRRAIVVGGACGVLAAIAIVVAMRPAPSGPPPAPSPAASPAPEAEPPPAPVTPPASAEAAASTRFYRIGARPLTHWGDYGHILQNGMTAHLDRVGSLLSLERTGPYMPPITFPGIGDIVVNAAGRKLLEASHLTGFTFQPVNKTRIVDLPWQKWDLKAARPSEYPSSGEPEDYILERPSSARVAQEMGDIWEVVVPVTATIGRPREMVKSFHELWVERASWNGADVFRGEGYGSALVTGRAKAWMEQYFRSYVRFEEFAGK